MISTAKGELVAIDDLRELGVAENPIFTNSPHRMK